MIYSIYFYDEGDYRTYPHGATTDLKQAVEAARAAVPEATRDFMIVKLNACPNGGFGDDFHNGNYDIDFTLDLAEIEKALL